MRIKFEVTKRDIRLGKKDNPCFCPVARSVKRGLGLKTGTARSLEIAYGSFSVEGPDGNRAYLAALPMSASEFVEQFDMGELVDPFDFTINFTKEALENAGITPPKEA